MLNNDYNHIIKKYIHDIENCTEMSYLNDWENILLTKSRELKTRIRNRKLELSTSFNQKLKEELVMMSDLNSNILFFLRSIHNKKRKLKSQKKFNQNIYFNMLKYFKDIIKEKLPPEEYEAVKEKAYKMAEKASLENEA